MKKGRLIRHLVGQTTALWAEMLYHELYNDRVVQICAEREGL